MEEEAFKLEQKFDAENNHISYTTNGLSYLEGKGLLIEDGKEENITMIAKIQKLSVTLDMGYYKPVGQKHLNYLKKLKLPADESMKQLSF